MSTVYAEVTQSGLTACSAECWDPSVIPPFGSLVMCQTQPVTYMFVSSITSQPRSGTPQARAYRKTQAELRAEYPHIFYYLTTRLELVPVCWQGQSKLHFQLPPRPAPLHSFIEPVSSGVYSAIMQSDGWLPSLCGVAQGQPLFDELLLAILYQALEHQAITRGHLERLSHTLAVLMGNNYPKIKIFLQRLELLIE